MATLPTVLHRTTKGHLFWQQEGYRTITESCSWAFVENDIKLDHTETHWNIEGHLVLSIWGVKRFHLDILYLVPQAAFMFLFSFQGERDWRSGRLASDLILLVVRSFWNTNVLLAVPKSPHPITILNMAGGLTYAIIIPSFPKLSAALCLTCSGWFGLLEITGGHEWLSSPLANQIQTGHCHLISARVEPLMRNYHIGVNPTLRSRNGQHLYNYSHLAPNHTKPRFA